MHTYRAISKRVLSEINRIRGEYGPTTNIGEIQRIHGIPASQSRPLKFDEEQSLAAIKHANWLAKRHQAHKLLEQDQSRTKMVLEPWLRQSDPEYRPGWHEQVAYFEVEGPIHEKAINQIPAIFTNDATKSTLRRLLAARESFAVGIGTRSLGGDKRGVYVCMRFK